MKSVEFYAMRGDWNMDFNKIHFYYYSIYITTLKKKNKTILEYVNISAITNKNKPYYYN